MTRTVRTITPHSRWLTASLVLVVVLIAGAQWWRLNATPFPAVGSAPTAVATAAVGDPHHHRILWDDLPAVEVHRAQVVVARGSAPAATSVSVCHPSPGTSPIGHVRGDLSRWCDRLTPLTGLDLSSLRAGPNGGPVVVVTVVPLAPGELRVEGVDLSFSDGFRRGQQRTGVPVVLDVRS